MPVRPLATFAFLLLVALKLVGCAVVAEDKLFSESEPPRYGEPIPAEFWEKVSDSDRTHSAKRGKTWPLPWFLGIEDFAISSKGASRFHFRWCDIGNPLIFLPVSVSASQQTYLPGSATPDAEMRLDWTPLWTWARNHNSEATGTRLKAWGVPLVISHVGGDLRNGQFSLTNGLWTLGPMVMSYRTNKGDGGYVATPLLLGGLLGSILWSDFDIKKQENRMIGHGPLFSYLGYSDITSSDKKRIKHQRLVVLGTLWHDRSVTDRERNLVTDSAHGPLWGIFGWGRKNTVPNVRFLWIPIPVGSGESAES